jgi:hypothetical protein
MAKKERKKEGGTVPRRANRLEVFRRRAQRNYWRVSLEEGTVPLKV